MESHGPMRLGSFQPPRFVKAGPEWLAEHGILVSRWQLPPAAAVMVASAHGFFGVRVAASGASGPGLCL